MSKDIQLPYGSSHTKRYSKSIISDLLVERDENGVIIGITNDVNLLLRQKTIHRKVGIDNLRDYVQGLMQESKDDSIPNFSDDELFQLIEPKSINNLTTSYEYAKYLQEKAHDVRSRFDELVAKKKRIAEIKKS